MITAGLAMLERCALERKAGKSKREPVEPSPSKNTGSVLRSSMQHLGAFAEPESDSDSETIVGPEKSEVVESPKKKWCRSRPDKTTMGVQPTPPALSDEPPSEEDGPPAYRPDRYPGSYTQLRAHETPEHLVCRLLLEKKKIITQINESTHHP